MELFKSLKVKDFRGVDDLSFDDLSFVNVFLGENNSGKSTVLEAILLILNMSNPDTLLQINGIRARKLFSGVSELKYYFRNMEVASVPNITLVNTDDTERHLTLAFSLESGATPEPMQDVRIGESVLVNTIRMNFEFNRIGERQEYMSLLRVDSNGTIVERRVADKYFEKVSVSLITAGMPSANVVNDLTELFRRNMKGGVLSLLQLFDDKITGVEILKDDVYLSYEGIAEMLPSSMMGDGLRRYISIVAAAANPRTSVVLIDELENGLHYSVYRKLWNALFALAVRHNKQIFVTTHSIETLKALNDTLNISSEYQDGMRLYTIVRTLKKGHQAYKYTYEGLSAACDNNVELR